MADAWNGNASATLGSYGKKFKLSIILFAKFQIISCIFLQKFAIPVGSGAEIQLVLPVFFICLYVLFLRGLIRIEVPLLILYLLFGLSAIFSQVLSFNFSLPSISLVLILYLPFTIKVRVSLEAYLSILKFFVSCVVIVSCITVYQVVIQYTAGVAYWVVIDNMVPKQILFSNYNYMQRLAYLSPYFKPNAFLLLEASMISQVCALSLVIEILFFKRAAVLGIIAVALVLSLSGTGMMILAFCAPALLARASKRLAIAASIGGVAVAIVGLYTGGFDLILRRTDEFSSQGSSAYARFIVPITLFFMQISDPSFLYTGNGAGFTPKGDVYLLLPFAKLVSEYGIVTFISFYAFILVVLFRATASSILGFAMFVYFNIAGSTLALPSCVLLMFILLTFYEIALASRDETDMRSEVSYRPDS